MCYQSYKNVLTLKKWEMHPEQKPTEKLRPNKRGVWNKLECIKRKPDA